MIAAKTVTAQHASAAGLLVWISCQGSRALLDGNSRQGLSLADSNTTTGTTADLRPIDVSARSTGKERDQESGLDYFGARYFSGAQGRFTSSDPLPWWRWQRSSKKDERDQFIVYIGNPQNWNMYAYVMNNPLNKTDPTGMNACGTNDDSTCKVTITIAARSKDADGHYNDQFTKLKGQAGYNATATVTVNGKVVGVFLAKSTPDSPAAGSPMANGTYTATAGMHRGAYPDIHINDGGRVPTVSPNPNQGGAMFATGDEIHKGGLNGSAVALDPTRPISQGCQTIYRDQYDAFLQDTGRVPIAGAVQGTYTVVEEANGSPKQ